MIEFLISMGFQHLYYDYDPTDILMVKGSLTATQDNLSGRWTLYVDDPVNGVTDNEVLIDPWDRLVALKFIMDNG